MSRQDQGGIAGIGDVYGQAGGDQVGAAGFERQGRIEAGAQIEAGAACGGIGRQEVFHARVEDFEVDLLHVQISWMSMVR